MPPALLAPALRAFGIGATAVAGPLPEVADDLSVSVPGTGTPVTGHALGAVAGAAPMTVAGNRLPRADGIALFHPGNAPGASPGGTAVGHGPGRTAPNRIGAAPAATGCGPAPLPGNPDACRVLRGSPQQAPSTPGPDDPAGGRPAATTHHASHP